MSQSNQEFLHWIYDRLVNVHGESPNFDYMQKFLSLIKWQPIDTIPFDTPIRVSDGQVIMIVEISKDSFGNHLSVVGCSECECELEFDELTGWKHL